MAVLTPVSQPQGQRRSLNAKKRHKSKPKIGRGNYVKAPLLRDKLTKPRWVANALVNNPRNAGAGGAGLAAATLHATKGKMSEKNHKRANIAEGALAGGAVGQVAHDQAWYAGKRSAEKGIRQVSNKGNYGPYKEGPHKAELNRFKREANKAGGGNDRAKAKYFNDNYPKHMPGGKARQALKVIDKKPVVAAAIGGAALAGAGIGALANRKVKKNMSISAFGVDHGSEVSKAKKKATGGRLATGAVFPGVHGVAAGKGVKGKLKSGGTELGLATVGATAGSALAGPTIGGNAGMLAGGALGANIAHKKGWLRPQAKGAM